VRSLHWNYFIIWKIWMLFFDVPSHSFRSIPTFSPPCEPCEWTRPRTMIYGGSDSQSDYRGLELRSTSRTTPTQPTFSLLFTCAIYLVEGWFFTTAATGSRRRRGSRRHWHCEFWWGQSSRAGRSSESSHSRQNKTNRKIFTILPLIPLYHPHQHP